jgi:hypothetical protein
LNVLPISPFQNIAPIPSLADDKNQEVREREIRQRTGRRGEEKKRKDSPVGGTY